MRVIKIGGYFYINNGLSNVLIFGSCWCSMMNEKSGVLRVSFFNMFVFLLFG